MRAIILLLIIVFHCTERSLGQASLEKQLTTLEYAAFRSENDSLKSRYLFRKTAAYILADSICQAALYDAGRVNPVYLSAEERRTFYWNMTLMAYLEHDTYKALYYRKQLDDQFPDTTTATALLGFLVYSGYNDQTAAALIAGHPELQPLGCIAATRDYTLPRKQWKIVASFIIPGSGMITNGNVGKGAAALSLSLLSAAAIDWMISNALYANAVIWGSSTLLKFYIGNIRLAKRLVEQKESLNRTSLNEECSQVLLQLLQQYPLRFNRDFGK